MADKPFVINDRRKFTSEGELRPDAPHEERTPEPVAAAQPEASKGPQLVSEAAKPEEPAAAETAAADQPQEDQAPPPPTAEQSEQASKAYDSIVDRLDTSVRAMDPGGDHAPAMTFERVIQSLYMQTLIQLGGAPEPGQPMQVDLMGARSTIDMLGILAEKTKGNLSEAEDKLVQSALFELRLGFLDVTQALAKQAAQRQPTGVPPVPGGGPSIVR